MTKSLFFSAIAKFTLGVLLVGTLIFLPAGTLAYPQGWLLMGILFIPMFLAGLFFHFGWWMLPQWASILGAVPFLAYPAIIARRIRNEEEVLTAELPGYAEYKQKVKWRLLPFIW